MLKTVKALIFFLLISFQLRSQILPKEGSVLNYRLIGFSFPSIAGADKYSVEIAAGYYISSDSFSKQVAKKQDGRNSKITGEVPAFGAQYTWRSICVKKDGLTAQSELHHFTTGIIPNADTTITRLRILQPSTAYGDAYVLTDGNKVMYDMSGQPIWYLPNIEGLINEKSWVRDLKVTPEGTITFLLDDHRAYEINYNGDILWKGPDNESGSDDVHYHHEFTRLANGHYMALSTEPVLWKEKTASAKDKSLYVLAGAGTIPDGAEIDYKKFPFETLKEYDKKGNAVWQWNLADYFKKSDLFDYKPVKGKTSFDVRVNAFYFDEQAKTIYISFKNISRIIKLKYPSASVINTYGELFKPGVAENSNRLFCHQHSCRGAQKGYLYLFDNGCELTTPPKITMYEEPSPGKGLLKKVWEYECTFDNYIPKSLSAAGNVIELPDHSFFVCMGTPYSKIFIVSRDKKVLWNALPEKWNASQKTWEVNQQYRASIINDSAQLGKLIWNNPQ